MFEPDKLQHFWASFGIAFFAPGLSVLAGFGKETLDVLRGGMADPADLLANFLGIAFAWVISPFF
ncbi:MAG: hypothetical protein SGI88_11915 [Candidatus Hydrogenedentes bacterium]|nr:hypothetical protein [Candidatus Hydrogenedentota bacterium]